MSENNKPNEAIEEDPLPPLQFYAADITVPVKVSVQISNHLFEAVKENWKSKKWKMDSPADLARFIAHHAVASTNMPISQTTGFLGLDVDVKDHARISGVEPQKKKYKVDLKEVEYIQNPGAGDGEQT